MFDEKEKILVIGTTAYAAVFIDMFECLECIEFVGCVENRDKTRSGRRLAGLPIYWTEDIAGLAASHKLMCALGTTLRKRWITDCNAVGFDFITLVHPSCVISQNTTIGEGTSIDAGSVVAGYSDIGAHVRIGRQASLGHHTTIGAFTTIHPGAIISGSCTIGNQVTIGTGTVVIDGIKIGAGAVIAAGTVVTCDVPSNVLLAGNPGIIKRQDYGPR